MLPESGIVTSNYLLAPDGKRYMAFFCRKWRIITDEAVPIPKFHSKEKWSLFGYAGEEIKIMIPGCNVIGLIACEKPPEQTEKFMENGRFTDIPVGIYSIE